MGRSWTRIHDDDVIIAHLSDLHLGCKGTEETWALVADFLTKTVKPQLVIVSGDLVDTPNNELYASAKKKLDALGVRYFVCAGNHDRHARGNRVGRLFRPSTWLSGPKHTDALLDKTFGTVMLHPDGARTEPIASGDNSWCLGLLGADSSTDADWSARGYVPSSLFDSIRRETRGKEWDLCLFAVHHHLFSVRELEALRQRDLKDLGNLTCLVNSGSLLEVLADSRVDVVLHGHEHMHNWGVYGTLVGSRGRVRVIGAGSATGNKTLEGGSDSRISFNLIALSSQKAGLLQRVVREAAGWAVTDDVRLFDAVDIRQSWLRRKYPDTELDRELVKYVEFTRERDVLVRWLFTRWQVKLERFVHPVTSWSGELDRESLRARVRTVDGYEVQLEFPHVNVVTPAAAAAGSARYEIQFAVPESHRDKPVTIELSYRWTGGATLTQAEVEALRTDGRDVERLRQSGHEFSTIWAPQPLASAELVISVPTEYAPAEVNVEVTQDPGGTICRSEAAELRSAIRMLARGSYSLRIPFPRTGRDYTLFWKPISADAIPAGPETSRYRVRMVELKEELLEAFCGRLAGTPLSDGTSISLYVQSAAGHSVVDRVGFRSTGGAPLPEPASQYDLNRLSVVTLAWRGVPVEVRRRPEGAKQALELGFADREVAILCLPLRFGFTWTNPPPLGCVRVGVFDGEAKELLRDGANDKLWQVLSAASTRLLSRLFEGV